MAIFNVVAEIAIRLAATHWEGPEELEARGREVGADRHYTASVDCLLAPIAPARARAASNAKATRLIKLWPGDSDRIRHRWEHR